MQSTIWTEGIDKSSSITGEDKEVVAFLVWYPLHPVDLSRLAFELLMEFGIP
jgi:hypothetical protein